MAKFFIECPSCGKYAEAKTGFFAKKKIPCSCGYTIDVRTEKLASCICPHCGNNVVFDQSKGEKAKCPVCHEPVNLAADRSQNAEFSCAQCGVRLSTNKAAETYKCPVCDFENNVAERLKSEEIRKDGLASVIKYEGDNETLIWKHPIEDFGFGSQLIVHESQEAVFFRDGQALDLFGAGRYTLETQQLPLMGKFYNLPVDNTGSLHSEVYYINLTTQMGIKWGTDVKVRLFDPASGLHVELGASGEFNIRVADSRKLLLKVVGTADSLSQAELMGDKNGKGAFRAMIMTQVKAHLAQAIRENSISVLEIDEHLIELSETLRTSINEYLEKYGLFMPEFFVSRIVTPDEDPDFKRMKRQYAEEHLLVRQEQIRQKEAEAAAERMAVEARTAARMKIIDAQGDAEALKIQKAAEAEAYKLQAEAEAAGMRMKGYTYQQETSRMVGMEAMKNGITGDGGAAGGIGDIAGLGIALGAAGSIANIAKESILPVIDSAAETGRSLGTPALDGWSCPECGRTGITTNFCPDCGAKRPVIKTGWDCPNCGKSGITTNFCPDCGTKRQAQTWDCSCGEKNISSRFCPNCGKERE